MLYLSGLLGSRLDQVEQETILQVAVCARKMVCHVCPLVILTAPSPRFLPSWLLWYTQ